MKAKNPGGKFSLLRLLLLLVRFLVLLVSKLFHR